MFFCSKLHKHRLSNSNDYQFWILIVIVLFILGHAEIIRALINAGADLQKADNFGSTPLHLACIYGYTNCVRVLCQLVAIVILMFYDINITFYSNLIGRYDCLQKKLDLEIRDKNGKTPLSLARNHKHNHIVRLLELEIKKRSRYNSVQPLMESWSVWHLFINNKFKHFITTLFIFKYN